MKISKILLYAGLLGCIGMLTASFATLEKDHHPFYVSVTRIDENSKEKRLEVSCKIFTDDFEKTLRMHYKGHIDLLNPSDRSAMNSVISDYIEKHLKISVDGNPLRLQFVGYEKDEEGVECYFQVNGISVNKTVDIFNDILFEYKPEQTNIVHVTVKGKRKSRQLVNPDAKISFDF
jgi:hypothetical protein